MNLILYDHIGYLINDIQFEISIIGENVTRKSWEKKHLKRGVKYYYTRGLPINYKGYKVTFKLTYTRSIEYYTLFDKIIIILSHKVMNKLF